MDDTKAREFAIDAVKKTAITLGIPVDTAMLEQAAQLGNMVVDALGSRVWRELHAKAVAEAEKIHTAADAEASRKERLSDR